MEHLGAARIAISLLYFEIRMFVMRDRHSVSKLVLGGSISVGRLADAKKAALRRGVWFRSLSRVERGIIDLTIRYVDRIKSTKLAMVVTAIMEKLQVTLESMADKLVRTVGLSLARKIGKIAISWGNLSAFMWVADRAFARYLAFCICKVN
jgi:hypothetical protein